MALISAYTAGAEVLELDVQLTRDGALVVSHDPTTDRLTGEAGTIIEMDVADIRKLDMSKTFQPRGSGEFDYRPPGRHQVEIETLPDLLDQLPRDVDKLIELKHDSTESTGRRGELVGPTVSALAARGMIGETVLYSKDRENLELARRLAPEVRIAAFDWELDLDAQRELMLDLKANGLLVEVSDLLDGHELSAHGRELERLHSEHGLALGALVYVRRGENAENVPTEEEYSVLSDHPFVWSLATDSMLDLEPFARRSFHLAAETFEGKDIDTDHYAFGYAKANRYCHVFQDDGVHVNIAEYDGDRSLPDEPLERRVTEVEQRLWYALKDWPFYSGGGFGLLTAIEGDFVAEVDYTTTHVGQATTLEMAAVNANPSGHQPPWNKDGSPRLPATMRKKSIFFDPHGAPPFAGVEHDEDDGYRVNANLGTDYDNNYWGRPVGNGKAMSGRLRLERRGPFFSALYRNQEPANDAPAEATAGLATDWVCAGVVRNESLNPHVFLRCAGKRWRQEREDDPHAYHPIVPVEFVFGNFEVRRFT